VPILSPSSPPVFSLLAGTGINKELADDVWQRYVDFIGQLDADDEINARATPFASDFLAPTLERLHLQNWLRSANELMTVVLPKLPIKGILPTAADTSVLALIRLFCDLFDDKRTSEYEVENRFLKKHVRKPKIADLGNEDAVAVQRAILDELKTLFTSCLTEIQHVGRPEWLKGLAPNPWRMPIGELLKKTHARFVELRQKAVWKTTGGRVFRATSQREINKKPQEFFEPIEASTPDAVRDALFAFTKRLTRCTTDCLDGDIQTFSAEAKQIIEKRQLKLSKKYLHEELFVESGTDLAEYFQIAFAMRNRDAHPDDETQIADWNRIQSFMARELGRKWRPRKQSGPANRLFHPDDLRLTSLEGTEIKLAILRGFCDGLEKLRPVLA